MGENKKVKQMSSRQTEYTYQGGKPCVGETWTTDGRWERLPTWPEKFISCVPVWRAGEAPSEKGKKKENSGEGKVIDYKDLQDPASKPPSCEHSNIMTQTPAKCSCEALAMKDGKSNEQAEMKCQLFIKREQMLKDFVAAVHCHEQNTHQPGERFIVDLNWCGGSTNWKSDLDVTVVPNATAFKSMQKIWDAMEGKTAKERRDFVNVT